MAQPPASSRGAVVVCVMVATAMVALETTIVATVMPQIVAQLGGLRLYSWVFSSFVLTQTAMTVVFGKLADVHGRRPVMLTGIAVFVAGSILAGAAWSMTAMIVARLIQGVGAGAILPVGLTVVADLYPARERGKVQGYLASVWAVSAVAGPVAGAFIVRQASWAWVFWVNVPIGLAAGVGFLAFLPADVRGERPSIDYAGACLFTLVVAAVMIGLTDTDTASPERLLLCAAAVCAGSGLFVVQERRAGDPMISFALWRRRPIAAANGAAVVSGMALMGVTTFLPMYVQGVLHRTPVVAGFTLTMVMVGWPVGATLASRVSQRFGLRRTMLAGAVLIPTGASVFSVLAPGSSPFEAGAGSLVMGLGMGLVSVSSLLLIQELVAREERASAIASNLFARNLGSTLGAAILGAVQASGLYTHGRSGIALHDRPDLHLGSLERTDLVGFGTDAVLQHSLHLTFCVLFAIALTSVLFTLAVPSELDGQAAETTAE